MAHDDVPSVGTTALAFYIGVGSRDESLHEWGMAHLLEHLAFKGAGARNQREIAQQMDKLGADINAFTTRDYTCFYARVLDSQALTAYRLLVDMVLHPWLAAEDLAREKNVVMEEMKESLDDPDDVLDSLTTRALYADDSYTHDILGTPESIQNMDIDALRAFFRRHYQPHNMVFAASGGAVDALLAALQDDFSSGAGPSLLPRRRPAPAARPGSQSFHADWEQLRCGLAVPAPGRYDSRYGSALMLASLLGGQNSSRLWQRLREEEGLVYSVGTQYAPESNFGDMVTYLGLVPENAARAFAALSEEIMRLAQAGPDADELENTRVALNTMVVMNQETSDARVMRLGRYALDGRTPPPRARMEEQLAAVSRDDICREAQIWTDWDNLARAMVGPVDETLWARLMPKGRRQG